CRDLSAARDPRPPQRRGQRPGHCAVAGLAALAWAAPTRPSPSPAFLVSIVTVTERPGRSRPARGLFAGRAIRTGTRCTILVKLPVALSGGSRLNWAPLAGAKLSMRPSRARPG